MGNVKGFLKNIMPQKDEGEFYEELEETPKSVDDGKCHVRFLRLKNEEDTSMIINYLREGNNVLILDRKAIVNEEKFKKMIEKIKKTANAIDGDIVGLSPNVFIATSSYIKVHRRNI